MKDTKDRTTIENIGYVAGTLIGKAILLWLGLWFLNYIGAITIQIG